MSFIAPNTWRTASENEGENIYKYKQQQQL